MEFLKGTGFNPVIDSYNLLSAKKCNSETKLISALNCNTLYTIAIIGTRILTLLYLFIFSLIIIFVSCWMFGINPIFKACCYTSMPYSLTVVK